MPAAAADYWPAAPGFAADTLLARIRAQPPWPACWPRSSAQRIWLSTGRGNRWGHQNRSARAAWAASGVQPDDTAGGRSAAARRAGERHGAAAPTHAGAKPIAATGGCTEACRLRLRGADRRPHGPSGARSGQKGCGPLILHCNITVHRVESAHFFRRGHPDAAVSRRPRPQRRRKHRAADRRDRRPWPGARTTRSFTSTMAAATTSAARLAEAATRSAAAAR